MDTLREQLADVQHAIWAHWISYQFSVCQRNEDGSFTIPADKVKRWERQTGALYGELTEQERESDRHQADKVLKVLQPELKHAQEIIQDLELKAMSANNRLAELEGQLEGVPVAALQTIEEIAPLIASDKLSSPEAWMKAWDEVSPWLASLVALRVSPENHYMAGEMG